MPKQTVITKKRRGPAPTGKGVLLGVRLQPNLLAPLDAWIEAQPEPKPSRPEAIRKLIELGLALPAKRSALTSKSVKVEDLTSQNDT